MFVHRGERRQIEPVGNLLVARAIAVFVLKVGDKIQNLLLSLGQRHGFIPLPIVGEQKGKFNCKVSERLGRSGGQVRRMISIRTAMSDREKGEQLQSLI